MRKFRDTIKNEEGKIIWERIIDVYEEEQKIGYIDEYDTRVHFSNRTKDGLTFYRKYKVSKKKIKEIIENCEEITTLTSL